MLEKFCGLLLVHALKEPSIKNILFKAPLPSDFGSRDLLFLQKPVNRNKMKSQILGCLFRRHDLGSLGAFRRIIFWLFHFIFLVLFFVIFDSFIAIIDRN